MKTGTFIQVQLKVEGLHNFPEVKEVFGEEVEYLRHLHRHNFGIRCVEAVERDNREDEFILLKRSVKKYLIDEFYDEVYKCCNFEAMSCETIAKQILQHFNFESVEVDEDGENSAIVVNLSEDDDEPSKEEKTANWDFFQNIFEKELNYEAEDKVQIRFIVGQAFSGKTFLSKERKKFCIEVGQIVRDLSSTEHRVWNDTLDNAIVERLCKVIIAAVSLGEKNIQIVGCRQVSIIKSLIAKLGYIQDCRFDYLFEIVYANQNTREKRFKELSTSDKNLNLTLKEIDEKDNKLGYTDLIMWIISSGHKYIVNLNSDL